MCFAGWMSSFDSLLKILSESTKIQELQFQELVAF